VETARLRQIAKVQVVERVLGVYQVREFEHVGALARWPATHSPVLCLQCSMYSREVKVVFAQDWRLSKVRLR
jgi:hypothetical protein